MKIYHALFCDMKTKIQDLFQSLSVKNYRIYFIGQGISLIGTWMQRTTMSWYVYRLTGSPLLLGLIGFLSQIPSVFISPFAGVWADKFNRLSILKVTQSLALVQAMTLGILVVTNTIQIWHLIILSLFSGIIEAADSPARHALVIELVQKKSLLTNAIALNSASFNGARLIGPSVAGIIIALSNEGICFLINGFSFIPVLISLFMIVIPYKEPPQREQSVFTEIKQGWKYAFHNLPIKFLISNNAITTFFGMSYAVLIPIFAKDILHGNAQTQGFLLSMSGVGALLGALYLASRKSIRGLNYRMVYALSLFGVSLLMFSWSRYYPFSLFLMILIGIGMMFQMSTANTILQSVVTDEMRGRVMSLHSMASMSVAPFGSLMVGALSKSIGAPLTLTICAIVCLLWSGYSISIQKKVNPAIKSMMLKHEPTIQAIYPPPDFNVALDKQNE
ncbi:MAG: MFS transporter [Candidatus Cloacimonadaceae bacterium]